MWKLLLIFAVASAVHAQYHPNALGTTPRPRNYHPPAPVHYVNIGAELAGDYKFGYDTGKGPLGQSFREETRLPDGTVRGAYGVLDEQGRQRIIRYTAGKDGFKAEGDLGPAGEQAAQAHAAPRQQQYSPPAQQYSAPAQQYNPPVQQYNPPAQQYSPPAQAYSPPAQQYSPPARQQYRSSAPARYDNGQWDPRKDDPYYVDGPAFIDVERLSYNIGTSQQG